MVIVLTTCFLYVMVIVAITVMGYRKTQDYQDYILGGRRFGSVITAMGVAATDMSGWLLLSVPALFYLYGISQIWLPLGLLVGSYINWQWIGPRLRVYTQQAKNSLTLPAFFQHRLLTTERSMIRVITAIVFFIFFTCYATSGFVACAKLFSSTFDLDYHIALYIATPLVIFYTVVGGYLAINWIDLFQGFLMLLALVLLALLASSQLQSDYSNLPHALLDLARFDPLHDLSFIAFISALAWGLGYFGQPHILARFMSARSIQQINIGKYICLSWMALAFLGAATIGFVGFYYFPLGSLYSPEMIFPELTQKLFSPWFFALVFAAIISAIISTVAAVLFTAASSLMEDFYHLLLRPQAKEKEMVWIGRLLVLLTAVFAAYLAYFGEKSTIFELVSHAWGGLGAAFGPLVILSLIWSRVSYPAALTGIILGGAVTLIWIYCSYYFSAPIFQLYELIPGALASTLGIVIVSYLKPQQSSKILEQHNNYLLAFTTQQKN